MLCSLALCLLAAASADEAARAKLNESRAAADRADYVAAVRSALAAEALFKKSGDPKGEAQAANQAGVAYLRRAEYPEALGKFEHALSTADAESEVTIRNNIGNVHFFERRYPDAMRAYQAALDKAAPGGPRQRTLINIAVLHEQLGEYDRALARYQEAAAPPSGLTPSEQGQLLSNLGGLYRRLKDPTRALEKYREAQSRSPDPGTLQNIGVLQALDLQDLARAQSTFAEAVALAQRTGNRRQESLAHLFAGEAATRRGDTRAAHIEFDLALAAARDSHAIDEQWTALHGLGRYREAIRVIESVHANLRRASLRPDFLAHTRDAYDAAIAQALDTGRANATDLLPLFERAPIDIAALQSKLDPNTVLVEYWMARGRGAAIWIRRVAVGVVPLPAVPKKPAPADPSFNWKEWGRANGPLLLGEIPLELARELVVVPLDNVPFEALYLGSTPLVRQLPVRYLPSAQVLLRPSRATALAPPWSKAQRLDLKLTTLWNVPEATTAKFMQLFYDGLDRGESRTGALRSTKLAFLDSGGELASPSHWAAFVLTGEGHPLTRVVPWWMLIAGGVLIGLAGAALRRYRRYRQ